MYKSLVTIVKEDNSWFLDKIGYFGQFFFCHFSWFLIIFGKMDQCLLSIVKEDNPWDVSSLYDFNYYCCPECDSKSQNKQDFINHASNNHPWVSTCCLLGITDTKEGCNRVHGLSAAIKLGSPEPKFLQSGCKLTCSQYRKTFVWHLIKKIFYQKRLHMI